jgi:hypothetical protein
MRRWVVVATTVVLVTTLVTRAEASAIEGKATPSAAKVKAGTVWTVEMAGAGCESESFRDHHTFAAVPNIGGDAGTYKDARKLVMTWTAGSASTDVFSGRWRRANGDYSGTYSQGGVTDSATLVPVSSGGCAVVATEPPSSSIAVGSAEVATATVTGQSGITPTGDVHFYLCPGTDPCTATSPGAVDLGRAAVSGSGATATATSASFIPAATGVYCLLGVYSGDGHYPAVSDSSITDGCFFVVATAPEVTTEPAAASIVLNSTDTDTATVTGDGGVTPTGSVTFYACLGDTCTVGAAANGGANLGTTRLSGSGGTATATSAAFTPSSTGAYCFLGVYSGDGNYTQASDGSTTDECFTVGSGSPLGPPLGLVALNKVGPHEVLSGGTGQFVVSGDILLNTDVENQPWSSTYVDPTTQASWMWDDALDAKTDSSIYVYGTIHSNDGTVDGDPLWPLDTCFSPEILGDGDPTSTSPAYRSGDPGTELPDNQVTCEEQGGSASVDYNNIDPTAPQVADPMQMTGAPPSPLDPGTDIACPGTSPQTISTLPTPDAQGLTTLSPGEYTFPVLLTGATTFEHCPNGSPGIYRFDDGLWIDPGAGDSVAGSNVVIATESPYPIAGNVAPDSQGQFVAGDAGNGAPCLPSDTMTSASSGNGTPERETSSSAPCGGTEPTTYGVIAYGDSTFEPDPSMSGTGDNFSLMIGGAPGSTVALSGPTSGAYGGADGAPGVVLYQDPTTQANYGLDAEPADGAAITINGVVYNASLSDYGTDAPLDYWDGRGGGIPFYAGGTLQTGVGTGWSGGPEESGGSVTLSGTAIVDDFNTDGATAITILEQPYEWPGGQLSSINRMMHLQPDVQPGHRSTQPKRSRGRGERTHRARVALCPCGTR